MKDITFFSIVDGVADAFPIEHAKTVNFSWVKKVRDDYKKEVENSKFERFNHLYRCPGIFEVMQTGYVVTLPWDISIETDGDGENFAWSFPTETLPNLFPTAMIEAHQANRTAKGLPLKPGSLSTFIKINTPWHVVAPRNVKFLIMPLPYPDNYDFESVIGILDPSVSTEINVQLRWNVLNGIRTLKAGSPIAQLIPLSEETFNLVVRTANEKEKKWIDKRNYLNNATIMIKRPLIQKLYNDYFHKTKSFFSRMFK